MRSLKINFLSNVAGKISLAFISFAITPIYLKTVGSDLFGLISFFGLVQSIFIMLDGGVANGYAQKIAQESQDAKKTEYLLNLTKTLECMLLGIGAIVVFVIAFTADLIATEWLNRSGLPFEVKKICIILMGIIAGLQFPIVLYQAGLSGFESHLKLNMILILTGVLRGFGGLIVLLAIDTNIVVYFIWQIGVSLIQLTIARLSLKKVINLNLGAAGRFDISTISEIKTFSMGMFATTIIGVLLTQADKIVVSKMQPLDEFGFYTMAGMLASLPILIAQPISSTFYPRLSKLVYKGDFDECIRLYHLANGIISAIVIPVGLLIAYFPYEILVRWTGNEIAANFAASPLRILVLGSVLTAIMLVPYSLQLAHSWTRLGVVSNVLSLIVVVPSMIILTSIYGAAGAAATLLIVYIVQTSIMIHLMHKKIFLREKRKWYFNSLVKPLVITMVTIWCLKHLFSRGFLNNEFIFSLGATLVLAILFAGIANNDCRRIGSNYLNLYFHRK